MDIIDRNPTPDTYEIKDILIGCGKGACISNDDGTEKWLETPCLFVDLVPKYYSRDRGFGSSVEKKQNPCTLQIELSELEGLQKAFSERMTQCFQFLADRDLLRAALRGEEESTAQVA
jgi:hypothetical protein